MNHSQMLFLPGSSGFVCKIHDEFHHQKPINFGRNCAYLEDPGIYGIFTYMNGSNYGINVVTIPHMGLIELFKKPTWNLI